MASTTIRRQATTINQTGKVPTTNPLASITGRFRSTVNWKPEEWQNPIDDLVKRLCLLSFLTAGDARTEPLELQSDKFAILAAGEAALTAARVANDMPRFRRILQQLEEKAQEFFQQARADMGAKQAPQAAIGSP